MRIIFNTKQFDSPDHLIQCRRLADVRSCFRQMESALRDGYYLAGFLSYEAGYAFERLFYNSKTYAFPLVCFGVYKKTHPPTPSLIKRRGVTFTLTRNHSPSLFKRGGQGVSFHQYFSTLRRIKEYLAAGDTYQVNYTFKHKFSFQGDPFSLYQKLKARQPTPYSAFIEADDFTILSLSPELFFQKRGEVIRVKPMKGTIGLGRGNAKRLENDPKNRAENLMIVDLLRNDLGRVSRTGTVRTEKLFAVEKLPTLYQMTSSITAEVPEDIPLYDIFRNIFPSGSVTGAPKIRTMQIIQELEKEERKIYCGAIGYITPQRDMLFNVAIRTILLDPRLLRYAKHCGQACPLPLGAYFGEMGIGSGITFDSDPLKELEECLLKANFLDLSLH